MALQLNGVRRSPLAVILKRDPLAYEILPFTSRAIVWLKRRFFSLEYMVNWMEERIPGLWAGMMCRKRYIDEVVINAVTQSRQSIVNLGAGLDTRAFRLKELEGIAT